MIKSLVAVFLAAVLTENYILSKFLGICPFLGVSKKLGTAVGMSLAVTAVMLIATAVTFPLYTLVLIPLGLGYLQTIVFILVIAALVQLVEIVLKKYIPALYRALGIYLPLITTNCAVLGITLLVLEKSAADPAYTSARASAILSPWCSLQASVSGLRMPTSRRPSRGFPSLSSPPLSSPFPSWALAASWTDLWEVAYDCSVDRRFASLGHRTSAGNWTRTCRALYVGQGE